MKHKMKLLVVAIFCVVCIGLLLAMVRPLAYQGPRSLPVGCARAASCPYTSCADCMSSVISETKYYCIEVYGCCSPCDYCLYQSEGNLDLCIQMGYCEASGSKEPPPQPPDQVDAGQGRDKVRDPQEPDVWFDFPPGAVSVPVEVRAYRTELPADVPPPANGSVGTPFYFGAWTRGEGQTVAAFDQPVVIHARYKESDLAWMPGLRRGSVQDLGTDLAGFLKPVRSTARASLSELGLPTNLPLAMVAYPALLLSRASPPGDSSYLLPVQEEGLRLRMYDPATRSWIKLCSRVDKYTNKVSAALLWPTPLEEGGNALFAITFDDTPALDQAVDDQGNTRLSLPGSNFKLDVLAGTVEVGTYFEVTLLPEVPESDMFKLLPTPVDIKACQADHTTASKIGQITQFPKPLKVGFDHGVETLARAGGRANLTIVSLQDRQWADLEELGYRVVRGEDRLSVDSYKLGAFSMGVR
jgi:hypothetical protein